MLTDVGTPGFSKWQAMLAAGYQVVEVSNEPL